MNLAENRIRMRISGVARSLPVPHFPHWQPTREQVHNTLTRSRRKVLNLVSLSFRFFAGRFEENALALYNASFECH
jgi:hypothetical protein